ncbi:hypothetical protein IWX81_002985 [Salinibacterium sp. CAN_S4]|uniref:HNH endonuclease signature motif containing protein n=1 Tax=Salinibacterium sp. CAN_S4 TaxID=2787727 RepID=UPI0018F01659
MAKKPTPDDTVIVLPSVGGVGSCADEELFALQGELGLARRRVDARAAVVAAEIARRSDRALGQQGLAARAGEASAEKLIQKLTGATASEARALTGAGRALESVQGGGAAWLSTVAGAVTSGELSVASAAAIASGLGEPSAAVSSGDLLEVAAVLVSRAGSATPEDIAKAARLARARLDTDSVADLEEHRRSRRTLAWFETGDGMTRLQALLDPESAAIIVGALTTALSPRRGGPRFVDPAEVQRAQDMRDDPRSNEQLAVDTLVEIVHLATRAAGSTAVFGQRSPAVRVHVQAEALETGRGFAHVEGQSAVISIQTAERHICVSGMLPILFDGNTPIDAGRTQRLHSPRQRAAIAAQWNGCAWTDCHRPPQFAEVHHLDAYNGSNTTLANGISLCRFHHMQLHANGWAVKKRDDNSYWLTPPPGQPGLPGLSGLHGEPIELHSKSPLQHTG